MLAVFLSAHSVLVLLVEVAGAVGQIVEIAAALALVAAAASSGFSSLPGHTGTSLGSAHSIFAALLSGLALGSGRIIIIVVIE